jgi:hypothetical protein
VRCISDTSKAEFNYFAAGVLGIMGLFYQYGPNLMGAKLVDSLGVYDFRMKRVNSVGNQ